MCRWTVIEARQYAWALYFTNLLSCIGRKQTLVLLILCLCAYAGYGQTAGVAHYIEFARTYGIVRYFSPNPYTLNWSESDWMKVCALLINRAETQPFETVFKPLAPTLFFSNSPDSIQDKTVHANSPAKYYYYSGAGKLNIPFWARLFTPGLDNYIPYYKKLLSVSDSCDVGITPTAYQYYTYPITKVKYLNIQHALPQKTFDRKATRRLLSDAKKYWHNHKSTDENLSSRHRYIFGLLSDKAVRIADVTTRWNIIRHFYPYYEEENLDWNRQLEIYLYKTIEMEHINNLDSLHAWYSMLCRFLNPIKDGHLFVQSDMMISNIQSTYLPEYYAPAETKFVNDTLLIRPLSAHPQPWRILHTIDSLPASEHLQCCRAVTNAATEAHRNNLAVRKLFSSPVYGTSFLILSSDCTGHMHKDTLHATLPDIFVPEQEKKPIRIYRNGILYVDASSQHLNEKQFLSAITPDIKGLCFDLRGLPSTQFETILAHLITSDITAPATEVPINCFPFQREVSWRIGTETLKAKYPHITLPATFICDANTVSWGETILMMVRHYQLGTIIGQTSAGTTGDMTLLDLPLFPFFMTGMRMHGMDGEQHHALGIIPDKIIPVYASDYMTNYDRTLHEALNTIQ